MSWSYESFNVSGYSTGITGVQVNEAVYLQVSGLKYNGTTFDNNHLEWLTGIGYLTSGLGITRSGSFFFDPDTDIWETMITITGLDEISKTAHPSK